MATLASWRSMLQLFKDIFLHIVMRVAFFARKIVVKVALFYTKNRSESSAFFCNFS
jgi:hypothetical protein